MNIWIKAVYHESIEKDGQKEGGKTTVHILINKLPLPNVFTVRSLCKDK